MGDQDDGLSLLLHAGDAVQAFLLEGLVAHRQHLVDERDVRVEVDGDGEPQAHVHARGIVLDLVIDKGPQFAEFHDLVEDALQVPAPESQDGGVQVDVLPAGEVGVEAGPQLQQGGDGSVGADGALVGAQDLGHQPQHGGFSRAVGAYHPQGLPLVDGQVDVLQGPEELVAPLAPVDEPLLQGVVDVMVEAEALPHPLQLYGGDLGGLPYAYLSGYLFSAHQINSANLPSSRLNT